MKLAAASIAGPTCALIIDAHEIYHAEQVADVRALAASRLEVDCWHVEFNPYD